MAQQCRQSEDELERQRRHLEGLLEQQRRQSEAQYTARTQQLEGQLEQLRVQSTAEVGRARADSGRLGTENATLRQLTGTQEREIAVLNAR